MKCLPCINDRRVELHIDEMKQHYFPIIAGTLGRIDLLFYRNVLSKLSVTFFKFKHNH